MTDRKPYSYLLRAYQGADPLEQKRIGYIISVQMGMMVLFAGLVVIHYVFGMHSIHYLGDFGAIGAFLLALYLIARGRDTLAGSVVIWSLVGIIFVYGVMVDYLAAAHVEFLRLYVTLFSILGVYILIISVYKAFNAFFALALIFSLIIIVHASTIVYHNGGLYTMTKENWSYFFAAMVTVNIAAYVTRITALFNRELMEQNRLQIEQIQKHNLNLNQLVDSQTSELKESNERLRSFAHIASHDLKEPLRSISGFVTLIQTHLQRNYPDDHTMDEYMGFVTNGTKRMSNLINDILAFSKLDTRKKDFVAVDMNEIMQQVQAQLDTIIRTKRAIIEYGRLPVITGQPNLILQVYLNLISNAIRFAKPGQMPHIRLQSSITPEGINITVTDNGIGIGAQDLERIFVTSYWHNTMAPEESTGMGLSICRKVIEFHGGRIWAESKVGEGSVFHCRFPQRL